MRVSTDINLAQAEALLERSDELALLNSALAGVNATGRGRLIVVSGEAGIGKTSLAHVFCDGLGSTRVLAGACEALNTPRPLGPLLDIAAETGGELADVLEGGANASEVLTALLDELRRQKPTVMVLEDLHWADEATLDLLRLLGRRVSSAPALALVTSRDELDRTHPLRVALGELPRGSVQRMSLKPLSADAVAALAQSHEVDPAELYARTAGNPFYVTEALAAGGTAVPDSVRDAVHARAARLEPGARELLDAVAIVPPRAELWLLEAMPDGGLTDLEQCIAAGMLHSERDAVAFRHEIGRVAIEEAIPPDRKVELHRRALAALSSPAHGQADLARLAHHAEAAGDAAAVLLHAPAAAERAARLRAHRESAAQFQRALRYAGRLTPGERLALLERLSYECYLTDAIDEAIEARRQALAEYEDCGDDLRAGDAHRWLSRLAWFRGDNVTAEREAAEAVALLEPLPEGPELAMAYSNMAQLRMLGSDLGSARHWGTRAIELAERLDLPEVLVHALNNVGTAELGAGHMEGAEKAERSLSLALGAGLEEHVARAYTNLGAVAVAARDYTKGDAQLRAGIAYCRDHDLDSWFLYMTGWAARSQLEQGLWEEAASLAFTVLDHPDAAAPSRISALTVLGRLRARRGDPDPWDPLDDALALARATREAQRMLPVAVARAEARWLAGEPDLVAAETDDVLEMAAAHESAWALGELHCLRRRAGIETDQLPPLDGAEACRLELAGRPEEAVAAWRALGCRYEAALALLDSDDETQLRASYEELRELGARPAAALVARALRERGARNLRRGPRAATKENPAGLTQRELEVLSLVADGMRNPQIAERLVLSRKTVDHHVSAILRKLGTSTRTEAATEAGRLGILEK